MVLVIIIVVAWAVILGPSLMKRRSRTVGGISSVSHFHRQLRVLEHSSPEPLVAPAYRLRTVGGDPASGVDQVRAAAPKLTVVGADRLPRPALAFLGEQPDDVASGPGPAATVPIAAVFDDDAVFDDRVDPGPAGSNRPHDAHARSRARRRRRDTLGVLSLMVVVTLMIGFIPGAGMAWALTLVSGLALAGYVALLVRMRRMAEERERKLHYLRPPATADGLGDLPVRVSGRYAHPSNQAAAGH